MHIRMLPSSLLLLSGLVLGTVGCGAADPADGGDVAPVGEARQALHGVPTPLPPGCGAYDLICCARADPRGGCAEFGFQRAYVAVRPGAICPPPGQCTSSGGGGGEQP